jgi:nucleoid-associated protein YgaU
MGRDFKIGLMGGVVLGFVALVWVATRPSQSPEARMSRPPRTASLDGLPAEILSPSPTDTASIHPEDGSGGSLPASLTDAGSASTSSPRNGQSVPVADHSTAEPPDRTTSEQSDQITPAPAESSTRTHIVRQRETLSAISMQYYGTPNRWRKIADANKDVLKDPNKIRPGTRLTIPD